ncbi:hypothetical protein [Fodinibius saliphilus]|uniref:hypothetical protein n=1 Tax=Fodinibius saliphilus TaxID=1920650 RepID=UPI00110998E0|nr:hypothetical protein [Fodinibius saliphilus]
MSSYYIKKYGVHELHQSNCVWLPIRKGMVKLGEFDSALEALKKARVLYDEVNPCSTCCSIGKKRSNIMSVD